MSKTQAMPQSEQISDSLLGLAEDLQLLVRLHDREMDAQTLQQLRAMDFPNCLMLVTDDQRARDAQGLLQEALDDLRSVDQQKLDELAADFADIYLTHGLQASPFESIWLDEDGLAMQEPMFQIREWYARYQLQAADWRMRSDDHLALQMLFMVELLTRCREAEEPTALLGDLARFMDEHLLRWVDRFAQAVANRCATPFYAGATLLTASYLESLRDLLVVLLDQPRPSAEEIEERMNPRTAPVEVPLRYMPGTSASW